MDTLFLVRFRLILDFFVFILRDFAMYFLAINPALLVLYGACRRARQFGYCTEGPREETDNPASVPRDTAVEWMLATCLQKNTSPETE